MQGVECEFEKVVATPFNDFRKHDCCQNMDIIKTLNYYNIMSQFDEVCILGTYLRKVYSVITYTNLILSKPKGFIGGNLKAALPPVPKLLPVFEFALPVDPEFWFQSYWQLPKLHLSLNPEQSLSKLHWFVFGETQL